MMMNTAKKKIVKKSLAVIPHLCRRFSKNFTFDRKKMAASAAAAQNKILQGIFISAHEEEAKKPKKKKRER
jgi:hypothetical protein